MRGTKRDKEGMRRTGQDEKKRCRKRQRGKEGGTMDR